MIERLDDLSCVSGRYEQALFRESGHDVYRLLCFGGATVEATGDPGVLVLKPGSLDRIPAGIRHGSLMLRRVRARGDQYDVRLDVATVAFDPEADDYKVLVGSDGSGGRGHVMRSPRP